MSDDTATRRTGTKTDEDDDDDDDDDDQTADDNDNGNNAANNNDRRQMRRSREQINVSAATNDTVNRARRGARHQQQRLSRPNLLRRLTAEGLFQSHWQLRVGDPASRQPQRSARSTAFAVGSTSDPALDTRLSARQEHAQRQPKSSGALDAAFYAVAQRLRLDPTQITPVLPSLLRFGDGQVIAQPARLVVGLRTALELAEWSGLCSAPALRSDATRRVLAFVPGLPLLIGRAAEALDAQLGHLLLTRQSKALPDILQKVGINGWLSLDALEANIACHPMLTSNNDPTTTAQRFSSYLIHLVFVDRVKKRVLFLY